MPRRRPNAHTHTRTHFSRQLTDIRQKTGHGEKVQQRNINDIDGWQLLKTEIESTTSRHETHTATYKQPKKRTTRRRRKKHKIVVCILLGGWFESTDFWWTETSAYTRGALITESPFTKYKTKHGRAAATHTHARARARSNLIRSLIDRRWQRFNGYGSLFSRWSSGDHNNSDLFSFVCDSRNYLIYIKWIH